MAIIVQKYGGSSVADVDKLRRVAARVAAVHTGGDRVVVVVSAMGNTTNELLSLARRVSPSPGRRELDMLISVGERITMALLSMAINDLGIPAVSFTGSQSGIVTDDCHAAARVVEVRPERVREALGQGQVVIVAGFQGVSRSREVTTLGRGGSDTTAVALAAALPADVCEIYTDVDGVFSADPRAADGTVRLGEMTFEEALTLFRAGSKVLHAEAMAFAVRHGIQVRVLAAEGSQGGTTIRARSGEVVPRVVAVAVDPELLRVEAPPTALPGLLERLGEIQAPVRAVRADAVLLDRRDFHQAGSVRWPPGVTSRPVAVATAAGIGCGRLPWLQVGTRALQGAGVTVEAVEADGDRLAWTLAPADARTAERVLHEVLVTRAADLP